MYKPIQPQQLSELPNTPIRAFYAVPLDAATHEKLLRLIDFLKHHYRHTHLRWTHPDKLHITLNFLGHIPGQQLLELHYQVKKTLPAMDPFFIELQSLNPFPRSHPHVLAVNIKISEQLANLYHSINQAMQSCHISTEKRAYLPHITLARSYRPQMGIPAELPISFPLQFQPQQIILFQSQPTVSGSSYSVIEILTI